MARKRNSNFRLGLDRKQLIETAILYGKSEKSAKKSNTANLERFAMRQILGKGYTFPELSEKDKREVKETANAWGVRDALKRLSYRAEKLTGRKDDENFLRLSIHDGFSLYYDGSITKAHIDELERRVNSSTVDMSGLIKISPYYQNLFIEYAEELEEMEQGDT